MYVHPYFMIHSAINPLNLKNWWNKHKNIWKIFINIFISRKNIIFSVFFHLNPNSQFYSFHFSFEDLNYPTTNAKNIETTLEQALKEAVDNETYRKVKRMSYSGNAANEVIRNISHIHIFNFFFSLFSGCELFSSIFTFFSEFILPRTAAPPAVLFHHPHVNTYNIHNIH